MQTGLLYSRVVCLVCLSILDIDLAGLLCPVTFRPGGGGLGGGGYYFFFITYLSPTRAQYLIYLSICCRSWILHRMHN